MPPKDLMKGKIWMGCGNVGYRGCRIWECIGELPSEGSSGRLVAFNVVESPDSRPGNWNFWLVMKMQKLESELWNHAIVGASHAAYTDRFHEAGLCATEPKTIQKDVQISGALTDEDVRNGSITKVKKRGNVREPSKDRSGRDDNKRTRTGNAFATTVNPVGRENTETIYISNTKIRRAMFHTQPLIAKSNPSSSLDTAQEGKCGANDITIRVSRDTIYGKTNQKISKHSVLWKSYQSNEFIAKGASMNTAMLPSWSRKHNSGLGSQTEGVSIAKVISNSFQRDHQHKVQLPSSRYLYIKRRPQIFKGQH
ncbi:hypothetical protein Tco_0656706 [Tanacetum coccineum]|uniref:Uncharacterized protein n=1 Tax=Tanacetum coccineum TaxID=301880 RepID=A0ABQ4X9I6_9ASTR